MHVASILSMHAAFATGMLVWTGLAHRLRRHGICRATEAGTAFRQAVDSVYSVRIKGDLGAEWRSASCMHASGALSKQWHALLRA